MEYFGIHGVDDLPQLKDFQEEENKVGEQADIQTTEVVESINGEVQEDTPVIEEEVESQEIETALEAELPPDVSLNEAI